MAEEKQQKQAAEAKPAEAKKRKLVKGRHASAIKRHHQSVKRGERNRKVLSVIRSTIKKVRDGRAPLREAVSVLHRAASRGVLHPRNASRHISRLASLAQLHQKPLENQPGSAGSQR